MQATSILQHLQDVALRRPILEFSSRILTVEKLYPCGKRRASENISGRFPSLQLRCTSTAQAGGAWPLPEQGPGSSAIPEEVWNQKENAVGWAKQELPNQLEGNSIGDAIQHADETATIGDIAISSSDSDVTGGANGAVRGAEETSSDATAATANDSAQVHGKFYKLAANVMQAFLTIRAFLPYGSWWDLGGPTETNADENMRRGLKRIWQLVAPDKLILSLAFAFLIVAALSELAIPHYVAATIFSAANGMKEKFHSNARLLCLMTFTYGVFSGLRGGLFGMANQRLVQRMRKILFATILCQDIAFFDKEAVGDLTSRLGADCQQVSRIIGLDVNVMLRNTLQGIGSLVYLVMLSKPLAASTAGVSAALWVLMMAYGRFQRKAAKVTQDYIASANEVAEEAISLARVVRTFGTEQHEVDRYGRWVAKLASVGMRKNVAYALWTWGSNTLYNATQVVALLVGGVYVLKGVLTAEQLTKYILYAEWVVHCTWWVGDHWASLMEAMGATERVFDLMDLPISHQLSSPGRELPELRGHILFEGVSFHYPTRNSVAVLDNVTLEIQPGELVALVGLSGSGKSTLVGLLQRLYEPTEGQVLIDGVPLHELDAAWFRSQLGVVSQEPRLFSTDVASNIAYGGGPVKKKQIKHAARSANAHAFIKALPERYRTTVDNARLSGGQKQRIAIARALVRDPVILILDEATSALDAESEHSVQVALEAAMHNEEGVRTRTVLVIAHRLSTVRSADRIVVMQGGRITEMGNHEELMALGGEYARLTKRQLETIP